MQQYEKHEHLLITSKFISRVINDQMVHKYPYQYCYYGSNCFSMYYPCRAQYYYYYNKSHYCIMHYIIQHLQMRTTVVHYCYENEITVLNKATNAKEIITVDRIISPFSDSIAVGRRIFVMGEENKSSVFEIKLHRKEVVERRNMLIEKCFHTLCHLNSFVYSIGGYDCKLNINDCEKYNVCSNKWSQLPSLNIARRWCAAFTSDNSMYAMFGVGNDNYLNSLEKLVLNRNEKWSIVDVANPPTSRFETHGIEANNQIIVFGGHNDKDMYLHYIEQSAI